MMTDAMDAYNAAITDLEDAKRRGDTRSLHKAQARACDAMTALLMEEVATPAPWWRRVFRRIWG